MRRPCLVSLPDDAILLVFSHFILSETLALFEPSDATNFAAAHPRFERVHRLAVVKYLHVSVYSRAEAKEQILSDQVRRQLNRYPRAETLHVDFLRWDKAETV